VIEVDGLHHDDQHQWAYDTRRQAWLEAEGYRVVRIRVEEIDRDLDAVMGGIYDVLTQIGGRPHPPPAAGTSP
jgi:very-short-patch-repair endonuclease